MGSGLRAGAWFNPGFIAANMRKLADTYSVLEGQQPQCRASFSFRSDLSHFIPCQFGQGMFLACKRMLGKMVVPVRSHLLHVRELIAKLKVFRVAALRIRTSWANVVHLFAFWNWSTPENPRGTVGVYFAINSFAPLNHSVAFWPIFSARTSAPRPEPATVLSGKGDFGNEAQREGGRESLLGQILLTKIHLWNKHILFRRSGEVTGLASTPFYSLKITR